MRKFFSLVFLALVLISPIKAQDLESGYFLGGNPFAFRLNPAFQSERNIVSVGLGMTGAGVYGNIGASNLLYPDPASKKLYLFLNEHVSEEMLLSRLHRNNYLNVDVLANLVTVGFWSDHSFFTVDVNLRQSDAVSLPYDFFRFVKGAKAEGTTYEFSKTGVRSLSFAEAAFGWSRNFDNRFNLGARVKFLVGVLESSIDLRRMKVTIENENWTVEALGGMDISSSAVTAETYEDSDYLNLPSFRVDPSLFSPAGWGGAVDLGFSWNALPLLTLSGAVLDLGTIRWNREHSYLTPGGSYSWAPSDSDVDATMEMLGLITGFARWKENPNAGPVWDMLPCRVHLGAEYRMPFYDRLSLGLLYQGRLGGLLSRHTGRMSLNWNPLDYLGLTTGMTFNRLGESFSFAFNLHPVGVNLVMGCDYIPFRTVDLRPLYQENTRSKAKWSRIPRDQMKMDLYIGINAAFGRSRRRTAASPSA